MTHPHGLAGPDTAGHRSTRQPAVCDTPPLSLPSLAAEINAACLRNGFPAATLRTQQVLCLAEETGEFVGAFRRWAGLARRPGTWDDVTAELADVVISAYTAASVLGIDLDAAWQAKASHHPHPRLARNITRRLTHPTGRRQAVARNQDPWDSDEAKHAVRAVLFKNAADKDRRAENGITGRVGLHARPDERRKAQRQVSRAKSGPGAQPPSTTPGPPTQTRRSPTGPRKEASPA